MKSKQIIHALIVDDETLARNRVKHMLKDEPDINIIGECNNGIAAYSFINNTKPDLIFLDIQMPKMTGIELVEAIGYKNFPAVIFITAYDQHAVKAFELCAIDYLLKPFDKERFQKAIIQAKERLKVNSNQSSKIQKLINTTKPEIIERIFVKDSGLISVLETDAINYIESSGNYVTIHSKNKSYLHRQTMKNLEENLDKTKFTRVHRSYIVQISKIKSLSPLSGGDYTIHLKNNFSLTLSRRYKENLSKYFTF